MFGAVEGKFALHVHVDLAAALQPPFQPLRREFVLHPLATRIRGAADRTERGVEIGDGLRRQAARPFLRGADDAVDLGGLNCVPLTGEQAVGCRSLRHCEKNRRHERARAPVMNVYQNHVNRLSNPEFSSGEAARHSGLMLASRITFAHFGTSVLIRAVNSAGVLPIGSNPMAASFCCTSASAITFTVSRWSRSITSFGAPFGTRMPCGVSPSWSGTPASAMVGTSGTATLRLALVTASARILPSLICGAAGGIEENAIGVWLPITDWIIGPPPWNGTATMSILSASLNISPDRCDGVPVPGLA